MRRFLQHVYADRFGGLADQAIGPFAPGLNVVYGPNEAGKSTLASLVGGVLFGWEDAHGVYNRYLPPEGGRSGRLTWADADALPCGTAAQPGASGSNEDCPVGGPATCVLERDEEGVRGDLSLVQDIDARVFHSIFSFTTDELRSLGTTSDITARLFTAVAGTMSSPAAAFTEVERRTVETVQDILDLDGRIERARERVRHEADQAELYKQEDRELSELRSARELTLRRIDALNGDIENLVAMRADLEALEGHAEECRASLETLIDERDQAFVERDLASSGSSQQLLVLDSTSVRVLRDRLDELAEKKEKADRVLDAAKENSGGSTAAYEALVELDEHNSQKRAAKNRDLPVSLTPQMVLPSLLAIAFMVGGIPLFVHGRVINSLSFTALGLGLVVCAVIIALATVVAAFRPSKGDETIEQRLQDAQWVMLQDQKKLNACQAEATQIAGEIEEFLAENGLEAAHGSIRQARSLLDEAHEQRSIVTAKQQRLSSLDLRIRSAQKQLDDIAVNRRRILEDSGLASAVMRDTAAADDPAPVVEGFAGRGPAATDDSPSRTAALGSFDGLIRLKTSQRDALLETSSSMSERIGELTSDLETARRGDSFSMEKFEYYQLRERLRQSKNKLIELLLAKRMLERSIAAWENQSKPEVYDLAGRLLSIITAGQWTQVSTSETGSVVAVSADGASRDPRHLSLGTCQQLYLALRMALLMAATDVGESVPVIADDILVNFDTERRAGAARALAELARTRQVIVLTCHEETIAALRDADPALNRLNLSALVSF